MIKSDKKVNPALAGLKGRAVIPSDKSISHRAAMFASLCKAKVRINNFSKGADCHSTLKVLQQLGVKVEFISEQELTVDNTDGFKAPFEMLDAGNSGTTIRLMSGILAGQPFNSSITGDESLCKRPMGRVIKPLEMMAAEISSQNNDGKAPLYIKGKKLSGIKYESPLASAQVKSCVLLAGLHADGQTAVSEPHKSRDHTERMLEYLGANIQVEGNTVTVQESELTPQIMNIPGDISSAAFFMVAAAIVPNSEVIIENVGLNETRTGIVDVLQAMGANIEILNKRSECGEEVGDIKVTSSDLKGITIEGDIIPRLIDEIPVIAVAATQAEGQTVIKDAEDLRNKESDRIATVCTELKKLGAKIKETPDGFIVEGKTQLEGGCEFECYHDHRLAMSGYVAGLVARSFINIKEFDWVNISFPEFADLMEKLKG